MKLDLVATGDIANMAGVTVDAVAQWVRRYPDFPVPVAVTSGGKIWQREDVEAWLRKTGRIK
jgi:predicted DNA-binding transcriptional regulator AlpA